MPDWKTIKTCRTCGRISKRDLDRDYCPVTASRTYPNRSAERCTFYVDRDVDGEKPEGNNEEVNDVR